MARHLLALAIVFAGSIACGPSREPEACSPERLSELEAEYVAEALAACAGRAAGDCGELPAIRARHAVRREEWVRCR